jgi:hypothetical protein
MTGAEIKKNDREGGDWIIASYIQIVMAYVQFLVAVLFVQLDFDWLKWKVRNPVSYSARTSVTLKHYL